MINLDLKQFFKPTKRKIVISFLLPLFWLLISNILVGVALLMEPSAKMMLPTGFSLRPFLLILALVLNAAYHYPLACFISKLVDDYRSEVSKAFAVKNIVILIPLILIFNPFFPIAVNYLVSYNPGYPCGARVVKLEGGSPAQRVNISKGEIILNAYHNLRRNGTDMPIATTSDLLEFLSQVEPGSNITITTDRGNYKIETAERNGTAFLGVGVTNEKCVCGDGTCEPGEKYTYERPICSIENDEILSCNQIDSTHTRCKKDC